MMSTSTGLKTSKVMLQNESGGQESVAVCFPLPQKKFVWSTFTVSVAFILSDRQNKSCNAKVTLKKDIF